MLVVVPFYGAASACRECRIHAEAEAGNNGEARLLIVRSSDEISHDDR